MIPLELTFGQTIWTSVIGALATAVFTAALVTIGARWVVMSAENKRADDLLEAERKRADLDRELSEEHDQRQRAHEHEFQSRQALRESYARLLVVQRRSRQASLALSRAQGEPRVEAAARAEVAHDEFIDEYHRLALDADRNMWRQLRQLRKALDAMLLWAREGDRERCEQLAKSARSARQNLEHCFRERLGYRALQGPKDVGDLTRPPGKTLG
jgi:hypothetical protein